MNIMVVLSSRRNSIVSSINKYKERTTSIHKYKKIDNSSGAFKNFMSHVRPQQSPSRIFDNVTLSMTDNYPMFPIAPHFIQYLLPKIDIVTRRLWARDMG